MILNRRVQKRSPGEKAYTLAETMVAVAVIGIMFVALYGGISSGFRVMQLTRENLRATQILVERMEVIRLYRWDQLTNSGYIPQNFVDYYYPAGAAQGAGGITYTGTLSIL